MKIKNKIIKKTNHIKCFLNTGQAKNITFTSIKDTNAPSNGLTTVTFNIHRKYHKKRYNAPSEIMNPTQSLPEQQQEQVLSLTIVLLFAMTITSMFK